jgi:hypothetical protein
VQQLGVDTRPSHSGEIQMKTRRIRYLELSRNDFNPRISRSHFSEAFLPESIKVLWARISALIAFQLLEWKIENEWHFVLSGLYYIQRC